MHDSFLRRAIRLAVENVQSGRGGPFGAVIAKDGQVISEGSNRVTSANDPTAHAEVSAIRAACQSLGRFDLRGCTIYSSCEPCPMCLGAIYWARLDALYFAASHRDASSAGFDDSFIYTQVPLKAELRSLPTHRSLEAEGGEPFALWVATETKIPY
ncbi:MAG TPA: nucleoside deaminase [Bryobacteraceae bacterium]|nr:nucleoside deaminase [Bryobacteraceae bacterium]HPT26018.1 nucleoside deaminase [Bryobacteraceae bacterium]